MGVKDYRHRTLETATDDLNRLLECLEKNFFLTARNPERLKANVLVFLYGNKINYLLWWL